MRGKNKVITDFFSFYKYVQVFLFGNLFFGAQLSLNDNSNHDSRINLQK